MELDLITHYDWILTIYDCDKDNSIDVYYEEDDTCKVLELMKNLKEMNIISELHVDSWIEEVKNNED